MNSCTKRDQILSRSFQNYAIITIIESIHYIGIDVVYIFNKLSSLNDFFQIFEFIFNYSSHFFFRYSKGKFIIMFYIYIWILQIAARRELYFTERNVNTKFFDEFNFVTVNFFNYFRYRFDKKKKIKKCHQNRLK